MDDGALKLEELEQMFESLLACREDRIFQVFNDFRKHVVKELSLIKKMLSLLLDYVSAVVGGFNDTKHVFVISTSL